MFNYEERNNFEEKNIDVNKLHLFKNLYCDAISCALGEFINVYDKEYDEWQLTKDLSTEELECLCEYATIKNKVAGVGELYLKVPSIGMGLKFLDKYGLGGKEILTARQMATLSTSDIVGGRIELFVENLLDYAEGYLLELSDFLGQVKIPVIIGVYQDLEEVGKLVNKYKMSPAQSLENFGFLDRECYIYGLNYIDNEDLKLFKQYEIPFIISPLSDAEAGRGEINLYNFIYNEIKFGFSSGKCYNVDMLSEAKFATLSTNNLMKECGLINISNLIDALECERGELNLTIDTDSLKTCLFDKKVKVCDEQLEKDYLICRNKVKEIVKKIKEKN